jgi:hypothetical protein
MPCSHVGRDRSLDLSDPTCPTPSYPGNTSYYIMHVYLHQYTHSSHLQVAVALSHPLLHVACSRAISSLNHGITVVPKPYIHTPVGRCRPQPPPTTCRMHAMHVSAPQPPTGMSHLIIMSHLCHTIVTPGGHCCPPPPTAGCPHPGCQPRPCQAQCRRRGWCRGGSPGVHSRTYKRQVRGGVGGQDVAWRAALCYP